MQNGLKTTCVIGVLLWQSLNALCALPTKEEALEKLLNYGIDATIVNSFRDIKSLSYGVCSWIAWSRCIPETKPTHADQHLYLYFYWLIAGLSQLVDHQEEDALYITRAIQLVDSVFKLNQELLNENLRRSFIEVKFKYHRSPAFDSEDFQFYAFKKLQEVQGKVFSAEDIAALYELYTQRSAMGKGSKAHKTFLKALNLIYVQCDDPENDATAFMFYLIVLVLPYVNVHTSQLNSGINGALMELEFTKEALPALTYFSIEELKSWFQQCLEKKKRKRVVQFSDEVLHVPLSWPPANHLRLKTVAPPTPKHLIFGENTEDALIISEDDL